MGKNCPSPSRTLPHPEKTFLPVCMAGMVSQGWIGPAQGSHFVHIFPLEGIRNAPYQLDTGRFCAAWGQTPGTVSASLMTVRGHNKSFREGEGGV